MKRPLQLWPAWPALVLLCGGFAPAASAGQVVKASMTAAEIRELLASPPALKHDLHGVWLPLDTLTKLSPEAAEAISEFSGGVSLNGLRTLDAETAAALARHQPITSFGRADLRLNGLRALPADAAEALAEHTGTVLLHGLESLTSVTLAKKLAGQWGELRLGLTELTPEVAAILATNRGVAEDQTRPGVTFRRADRAASVLRLDGLRSLSPATAEALVAHQGVLVLNGLTSLEPPAATALAKRSGTLVLNGLSSISTETAVALAAFPGELVLKGVTKLHPDAAAALARHAGRLHLTGLRDVPDNVRTVLEQHPRVRLPEPPPESRGESG